METGNLLRHQIIESLMAQHTEEVADAAIGLWESMAIQIISIIGEGGFNSLYARSVFLTQPTFPWLVVSSPGHPDIASDPSIALRTGLADVSRQPSQMAGSSIKSLSSTPPQTDHRFAKLKMSLEGQSPAQASKANSLLLITFTDILASLIGEQLTTSILRLAWGTAELLAGQLNDASNMLDDEKLLSGHPEELKNE